MVTVVLCYWPVRIKNAIFIAGFPHHTDQMQLEKFFSKFGQIQKFIYGYQGTYAIIRFCNRFVLTNSLNWLLFVWSYLFVCVCVCVVFFIAVIDIVLFCFSQDAEFCLSNKLSYFGCPLSISQQRVFNPQNKGKVA
jgi:hypothetical protein